MALDGIIQAEFCIDCSRVTAILESGATAAVEPLLTVAIHLPLWNSLQNRLLGLMFMTGQLFSLVHLECTC